MSQDQINKELEDKGLPPMKKTSEVKPKSKSKTPAKEETGITKVEKGVEVSAPVAELQAAIDIESQKRAVIEKYIQSNLKEGVDYGVIEMESKKTGKTFTSKPTLFKSGSERIASLLKVRPVFKKDAEVWEMLGSKAGIIALVCELVDSEGKVIGEGRGACTIIEKSDVNVCIKIAEKRAQIDAVLRTAGISDRFTQDLDDMAKTPTAPQDKPVNVTFINTAEGANLSKRYFAMMSKIGFDGDRAKAAAKNKFKLESYTLITKDQLNQIITALDKKIRANEEKKKADEAAKALSDDEAAQLAEDFDNYQKGQTDQETISQLDGTVPTDF